MINNIKNIVDNILKENENKTIHIPLKDLIWTIVVFSYDMKSIEDKVFSDYPFQPMGMCEDTYKSLIQDKEYLACRRNELARIIGQYTDFNTQKIWDETDKIFTNYPLEWRG
jgi:hypothetical protein